MRGVVAVVGTLLVLLVAAAAGTAAPAAKPLELRDRVLRTGELVGFKRFGPATTFSRPRAWVSSGTGLTRKEVSARVSRLTREGFVVVISQLLAPVRGSRDRGGLSWALRVRSAAMARNELKAILSYSERDGKGLGRAFKAFRVSGIPGARGFRLVRPGIAADHVVFSDGPFVYLVSTRWEEYARKPPARFALVSAAKRLYRRVHGSPPA